MKSLLRPYRKIGCTPLTLSAVLVLGCVISPGAPAQTGDLMQPLNLPPALLHSSSQGYMGVLVGDVDSDASARLKLRDAHGAVVTLIDHDAPAAQAGVRVNDVIVEINGQKIENAEQFSRVLRELPAGRDIVVVLSRDGAAQTVKFQLVDRKKMEHEVWTRLDSNGDGTASAPSMSIVSGNGSGGADIPSGGFHMPFFGSTLNVGAMVEPLTAQMADYLGIKSGLMIKQVVHKSEADAAGLKAFDVVLKVGTEAISTSADWDRTLRAYQNKTVQVVVLRDRKQQTLTLQVDSRRRRSSNEPAKPAADAPLVATTTPAASAIAQP
ncbi:MAG TPA: PDZ domain-containing protein [Terracidiphilus sp.]|nr:PDZ domain-containing protein [Terracidiphilus sp.]